MNEDLKLVLDTMNAKFDEVYNEIRTFKTDVNARLDKLEYQVKWNFDETLALLHVMDEKINDVKADVKDVKTRLELTESITKQNTYDITLLRAKA